MGHSRSHSVKQRLHFGAWCRKIRDVEVSARAIAKIFGRMVCGDVWIWMLLCWVGVLDDDGLLLIVFFFIIIFINYYYFIIVIDLLLVVTTKGLNMKDQD